MSSLRALPRTLSATGLLVLLAAGCSASSSNEPNTAGSATAVAGEAPTPGQAMQGGIAISGVSIARNGDALTLSGRITNTGSADDTLLSVGSQISTTTPLQPALTIPKGATVTIGGSGTRIVLRQNARLEQGGTVVLAFDFRTAGTVQVFSSFH